MLKQYQLEKEVIKNEQYKVGMNVKKKKERKKESKMKKEFKLKREKRKISIKRENKKAKYQWKHIELRDCKREKSYAGWIGLAIDANKFERSENKAMKLKSLLPWKKIGDFWGKVSIIEKEDIDKAK